MDTNELLARIDERTKNIEKKLDSHMEVFKEHVKDDARLSKRLDGIDIKLASWAGVGTGAGSIIGFIISKLVH